MRFELNAQGIELLDDGTVLEIVPDSKEGQCHECYFEDRSTEDCPRYGNGKLKCAYYTKGPAGVWKEMPPW